MRLQLELPEDAVRQLKDLMAEAGIETYKELFSNALTLLKWSVREVADGRVIASLDAKRGVYKELAMPVFDAVARRSPPLPNGRGSAAGDQGAKTLTEPRA